MTEVVPGLTALVLADSRVAQHRQVHVPAGQLALQQPSLAPPISAQVTAGADASRDVRDRNRERRRAASRKPGRGTLLDREL